jgi:hypothetical protein
VISKSFILSVLAAAAAIFAPALAIASITFVAAGPLTDSSSTVTTVSIALPAGVQSGDTLLAQIIVWDASGSDVPAAPSGWASIRHDSVGIASGDKISSWLYYRVAGTNEPASYVWNISSQYAAAVMGAWRGASLSPIDHASGATKGGSSSVSLAAPSLTPANNGELQVYFYGSQGAEGPAITLSSAITQRLDSVSSKEGFSLGFGDHAAPSAGTASPTYTATASLSGGNLVISAQAVLLIPTSQSGGPTATPTPTMTGTPTATVTHTPTATVTRTPTATVAVTPTATGTIATTTTATATGAPTATSTSTVVAATPTAAATPGSAAIIFVGASALVDSSSPVTSITISLPAGVQSGDTLLAQIVVWDASGSDVPAAPSGWASIRHDSGSIANGDKITTWLYYRVAGGSEPASYGWSISSQYAAGVMGAWRNASLSPIDQASGAADAGATPLSDAAPSLSPGNNNELQVYFYGGQGAAGPALTLPGAITQRLDVISAQEGFSLGFGDLAAPPAGNASPTYNATATLSGGTLAMSAQAVLLIPASQSGTPNPTGTQTPTPVSTIDVLTYHNDNARTGQNLYEQILTTTNVNSSTFGKLYELPVDGKVDGQPLIKTQLNISGKGLHNVLYVVTENDTIYAFDADNGTTIWTRSMLGAGEVASDDRSCGQVEPEIGITSTPVIDPSAGANGVIYLVAMSKDSSSNYYQRIHALDLTTGAEEFGGPLAVAATVTGSGAGSSNGQLPFAPKQYKERAGLLLLNGVVYTTWASHCDIPNYTGWIISYAVSAQNTLVQNSVLNVTPNGSDGAIWQAGAGPATDTLGNIYFLDANGTFDTATNGGFPSSGDFGNAFIKLSTLGGLQVVDYFTMFDTGSESSNDVDLGSGGALVLPDMVDSTNTTRHLAVGAGKDSNIYLVDRDNMGKYNPTAKNSNVYQELAGALPGGEWAMPAYFNNTLYYGGVSAPLQAFAFSQARLVTPPSSSSSESFAYPGTTPSISANGSSNAIVWAVENASTGVLHAYDATKLTHELYNSNQNSSRDSFQDNKYITPTIANGKVYVGTPGSVAVFGLMP